jgi:hypothetical protein
MGRTHEGTPGDRRLAASATQAMPGVLRSISSVFHSDHIIKRRRPHQEAFFNLDHFGVSIQIVEGDHGLVGTNSSEQNIERAAQRFPLRVQFKISYRRRGDVGSEFGKRA